MAKLAKPRLTEAGPGAGKTHAMVDEIVSAAKDLPPHRFLAAITYTNAAANTIRERLAAQILPRRNVFIGTTHSFVNRFVLAPCAELFSLLPEDRIYAPIPVHEKGRGASRYTENLIKKGIIPYDAMIPKARKILKKSTVIRNRICGRLAYIFVDEFQDADVGMLEVFDHFRKAKKTTLFVVGDPEQYVMSFTYRGNQPPAFDKIPFFRFKKLAQTEPIIENHRSNKEIVIFANKFRSDLQQKAVKPQRKDPRVLFIPSTELKSIVQQYQDVSERVEIEKEPRTRLYLSEENATFDSVSDQFNLTPISNLGRKNNTLLGDTLEILSLALDRSQRKIYEKYELSRLQLRAVGVKLLKEICSGQYDIDQLILFVSNEFGHKISKSRIIESIEKSLNPLVAELSIKTSEQKSELYA